MNTTFKAVNMELTEAIKDYAMKRVEPLSKFVESDHALLAIEVMQTTKHHKQGEIFRTEMNLSGGKMNVRAVSQKEDLYASIDDAKEELMRVLISRKEKSTTLFRRGASKFKSMVKGFSWKGKSN